MADRGVVGVGSEVGSIDLPRGEGPVAAAEELLRPRGGVSEVRLELALLGEGDDLRPLFLLGDGEEKTSSRSTGTVFGETPSILPWLNSADGTRLDEDRNGDFVTNSFLANPFQPIELLGVFFPAPLPGSYLASGELFSLLPEPLRSRDTLTFSMETFLAPLTLAPAPDGVLDPELERLAEVALMPSPIAALGVDDTPEAFSGDCPSARGCFFS